MNVEQVRALLAQLPSPEGDGDLVAMGNVGEVEINGDEVLVVLQFKDTPREVRHALEDKVYDLLVAQDGVDEVVIEVEVAELPDASAEPGLSVHSGGGDKATVKPAKTALSAVKNIIAVASGKGGVGKSTVAVNLALALAKRGAKVGICDIDIYGPSVPLQLGVADSKPGVSSDQKSFLPVEAYGLKVMSIGFLVDDDTPVIWRGPIVSSVVKQFLDDVEWGVLDYLVIDMPPGTGDAQLTLTQSAPITGTLIVTTPSELALVDAVKGLQMFRKVETPVLGLVENMSHYLCPSCGHESKPFSSGGTARVAKQFGTEILAQIPLWEEVQQGNDTGKPVVAVAPDGPQAAAFLALADTLIAKVPYAESPSDTKKKGFLKGLFGR